MSDDVTLEDLQKVYKRLEVLEAGLKETQRLQKIEDDFDKDQTKNMSDHIKSNQDSFKKVETRLTDLEKKVKK